MINIWNKVWNISKSLVIRIVIVSSDCCMVKVVFKGLKIIRLNSFLIVVRVIKLDFWIFMLIVNFIFF